MTEKSETIVVGEVNVTGKAALIEWLQHNLRDFDHAETWAASMIAEIDGSFAGVRGISVELSRFKSRTGNPVIYSFGPGEFDLVTYNDRGEVIARKTA